MWISRAVFNDEIPITRKKLLGFLDENPGIKVRFPVGDSRRFRSAVQFFNLLQKSGLMVSKPSRLPVRLWEWYFRYLNFPDSAQRFPEFEL